MPIDDITPTPEPIPEPTPEPIPEPTPEVIPEPMPTVNFDILLQEIKELKSQNISLKTDIENLKKELTDNEIKKSSTEQIDCCY